MTIEEKVFEHMRFDPVRMAAYGFEDKGDCFAIVKDFMDGDFTAVIEVDKVRSGARGTIKYEEGIVRSVVVDNMNGEEYTQLRNPNYNGSFVNTVRAAYEELLRDIASACCDEIVVRSGREIVMDERLIREVLDVADSIPPGRVASYGRIAAMIGRPKNARMVGRIMSLADRYGDHPCHRVVNSAGRTVPGWTEQRTLLEAEGVTFRPNGNVDMKKHSL